jgi:hypothetical protein
MTDYDDLDHSDGISGDEEYQCEKCGKVFYIRIQDGGQLDFDEGTGRCDVCKSVYCENCGNWHTYGGKYDRLCETCFNEELLNGFAEWYNIFQVEYCEKKYNRSCDECPFFFKKGCMMMILDDLKNVFHTNELTKRELNRLQQKNKKAVAEWQKELKEAIGRVQKK